MQSILTMFYSGLHLLIPFAEQYFFPPRPPRAEPRIYCLENTPIAVKLKRGTKIFTELYK